MRTNLVFLFLCILMTSFQVAFSFPDWTEKATLPAQGHRKNIYQWESEFEEKVKEGKLHALYYPVDISGMLIPFSPFRQMFEEDNAGPVKDLIFKYLKDFSDFETSNDIWNWLGLQNYPEIEEQEPVYFVPFKEGVTREDRMGLTLMKQNGVELLSFSCAACHTGNLFGKKIIGMTNRFSRANELFYKSKSALSPIPSPLYQSLFQASAEEVKFFKRTKENLKYIGVKTPAQLGLDTSLAQVALSLARRKQDDYATKSSFFASFPRPNALSKIVADSKPMVWWNLKYKTRWLSDGSILSGNPVLTNFLWNEIGRGTDLKELEHWIETNQETIEELTTAVFATEAPAYLDFFPASSLNIVKAKKGEQIFGQLCQKCHGRYEKNWSHFNEEDVSVETYIATKQVHYRKQTRAKDVGTDPLRFEGMKHFSDELNRLKISRTFGIKVKPQKGYVPPPLVGIWARWPYMHNNSIPSLCALLSPENERPKSYQATEAIDKNKDFDLACVGYPEKIIGNNKEYFYDTSKEGLSNKGHAKGIFIKNGKNLLAGEARSELIEFLKTL